MRTLLALCLLALTPALQAQPCEGQFMPGVQAPGVRGTVEHILRWDPDGTGPLPQCVTIGGLLWVDGEAVGIAYWDGSRFRPVATPAGYLDAAAVKGDGTLMISVSELDRTARVWARTGTQWTQFGWTFEPRGPNSPATVNAILPLPDGSVVVGGGIEGLVRRSTGGFWEHMHNPQISRGAVHVLKRLSNGHILAGGDFGEPWAINKLALWNGSGWTQVGDNIYHQYGASIEDIEVTADGDIIVSGTMSTAGTAQVDGIARWNGSTWSAIGTGNHSGRIEIVPGGDIIAAGRTVERWNGTGWTTLVSTPPVIDIRALSFSGGVGEEPLEIHLGGRFGPIADANGSAIASLRDGQLNTYGDGFNNNVEAVKLLADGNIAVGGDFSFAPEGAHSSAAIWNGTWSPLPLGPSGSPPGTCCTTTVTSIVQLDDGSLIYAGEFGFVGSVAASCIARWAGEWAPMDGGILPSPEASPPRVMGAVKMPNGDLVVTGHFTRAGSATVAHVARWNGQWSSMGDGLPWAGQCAVVLPAGDLYIGSGRGLYRWDGSSFVLVTIASGGVEALAAGPHGGVLLGVSGEFPSYQGGVLHWDGATLTTLGQTSGVVYDLVVLANSDVIAGGIFQQMGGVAASSLARYRGGVWSPITPGLEAGGLVRDIEHLGGNDFAIGGHFFTAGGQPSAYFARYYGISADFNRDGDTGTDQDIEAFFACIGGQCCPTCATADFNGDGDTATDQDIEAFFRVLGGGGC
ncbi:MAG TPA: hypothetical protein VD997_11655 [Phycisphaerales bacterium]|nr:hypothetical protein [Phycisphaerales bacterium]